MNAQDKKLSKIAPELKPVLEVLLNEGREVYTYSQGVDHGEITSLFWYENCRVLVIQPSSWRNYNYARDRFSLGVCYCPSSQNGSGCGLSPEDTQGTPAQDLLNYRDVTTWVRGITNYRSMSDYLTHNTILEYFLLTKINL
jgi:hypothetical protein